MQTITIDAFQLIGIGVRTSNQNQQAATDIPALWSRFMTEGIQEKIPHKISPEIYAIYTNYEGNHTQPYDAVIGCKVSSLEQVPKGMQAFQFDGGKHKKIVAKGDLTKGAVINAWLKIWESDIDREYVADFEIYGEKAMNPEDAEVDILVRVK